MLGSRREDSRDQVHAVLAGAQREAGLMTVFRRQPPHHRLRHVGRIGEDEVVAPSAQPGEEIGTDELDAMLESMQSPVASGDGERGVRDVDRVDLREGKGARRENGQAG